MQSWLMNERVTTVQARILILVALFSVMPMIVCLLLNLAINRRNGNHYWLTVQDMLWIGTRYYYDGIGCN
jgi:hypothetical protein